MTAKTHRNLPECSVLVLCVTVGSVCVTGEDDDYQDASSTSVNFFPIDDKRSDDGDNDDDDDSYRDAASLPPAQLTSAAMHRKHGNHHHHPQHQPPPQQQHAYHPHDAVLDPTGRTPFPPSPREMYSHHMGYIPATSNGHQVTANGRG